MQVRTVRLLECLRHSLYPDSELTFLNDVGGNSVRAQRQKENDVSSLGRCSLGAISLCQLCRDRGLH